MPVSSVKITVGTLGEAFGLAAEHRGKAHSVEVAPVNRRDGGTRSWHGLAKTTQGVLVWAPLSKGAVRPLVTMSPDEIAALPALPPSAEGYHVLRFLTETSQVLETEILIDPRRMDVEMPQAPPPPPSFAPPPPPAPRPHTGGGLESEYLELLREHRDALRESRAAEREARASERETFAMALTTLRETATITRESAEVPLRIAKVHAELSVHQAQELIGVRQKNDELAQANVGLQGLNAQLENEAAVPKMLGEIYSKDGGAEVFSATVTGLAEMALNAVRGKGPEPSKE